MQAKTEIFKNDEHMHTCLNNGRKKYFRCAGTIKNKKSWLYGKPCGKILAEANSRGLLNGKIKCPHCGHMNEV